MGEMASIRPIVFFLYLFLFCSLFCLCCFIIFLLLLFWGGGGGGAWIPLSTRWEFYTSPLGDCMLKTL